MRIVSGQSGTAWLHCDAGVASRLFFFFDFYPKWVPRQFGREKKTINLCMEERPTFAPF